MINRAIDDDYDDNDDEYNDCDCSDHYSNSDRGHGILMAIFDIETESYHSLKYFLCHIFK